MHPGVSFFFFAFMVFDIGFMLVTRQAIWNGRPAFHRDYYPVSYWMRFIVALAAAAGLVVFCIRDWISFFL